jgi:hypothetical protein
MKSKAQQFRNKSNSSARVTPPHLDRKKATHEVVVHFASSAFLNSPDPSKLPVPDFDDDEEDMENRFTMSETTPVKGVVSIVAGKTDTLKQFLNIRSTTVLTVSN